MPAFTVRAKDFRALEALDWSPEGVCLLTGPNGAGKSTTLSVLTFLRALLFNGPEAAFRAVEGSAFQRHGADPEEPVEFSFRCEEIEWRLRFPMSAVGMRGTFGEEVLHKGQVKLHAAMFGDVWTTGTEPHPFDDARCCARVIWDRGEALWMQSLWEAVTGIRVYDSFWLNQIARPGQPRANDTFLHHTGNNLWSVLATWKASPIRFRGQFEWVLSEARKAFPDLVGSIEFDRGFPLVFRPGESDPANGLPPARQAEGLLTGLAHLTAIAGARDRSIVAFDEVENQLHPHAIRSIIAAMRQQADERALTVVLTTHSPVVMNEFKGVEDSVFVLDPSAEGPTPKPLDQVHDPAWLSHFALGDLYERERFAAPPRS